jgi:type IV secretion system protein VirB6
MPLCAEFAPDAPFAVELLRSIDCRVEALGEDGYLALAGAGSPLAGALVGLLTIAIALAGYRLLLGERLALRDGALLALRIGIVLALATQWPAYQALVYRVVIDGPAELSGALAGPIGGTRTGMAGRVQAVWQGLDAIAHPPLPSAAPAPAPPTPGQAAAPPPAPASSTPLLLDRGARGRISAASLVLLVTSMGGLIAVRVVAGFLLALGPLFAACLLFAGLRGLFEGWVRGLAFAALGSVAVTVVLGMELAVLEPQALAFAAALAAGPPPPGVAGEMFATVLLFGFAVIVALAAVARVAAGFRLPGSLSSSGSTSRPPWSDRATATVAPTASSILGGDRIALLPPSRAAQLAETIRIANRRDALAAAGRRVAPAGAPEAMAPAPIPLGQSARRSLAQRRSAAAARRDGQP